jgi:acyl carrier protein
MGERRARASAKVAIRVRARASKSRRERHVPDGLTPPARVMHIPVRLQQPNATNCDPCEKLPMLLDDVKAVVGSALQIRDRMNGMDADTPLLGAVPELDSIAVVNLITALEEHFGITVADDEIGASAFETLGSLARFVEGKLAG